MNVPRIGVGIAPRAPRRLLCERVIRNVGDETPSAAANQQWDTLDLTWLQCTRRTLRARTRGGREVALLLPRGSQLRHGDVIFEDAAAVIVVSVAPCAVWIVRAADAARLLAVAVELGNLHTPVEVTQVGELVVLPDGPVLAVLRRHGLSHHVAERRFEPLRASVDAAVEVSGTFRVLTAGLRQAGGPQLTNSLE